jgi:hypothetical protein
MVLVNDPLSKSTDAYVSIHIDVHTHIFKKKYLTNGWTVYLYIHLYMYVDTRTCARIYSKKYLANCWPMHLYTHVCMYAYTQNCARIY